MRKQLRRQQQDPQEAEMILSGAAVRSIILGRQIDISSCLATLITISSWIPKDY